MLREKSHFRVFLLSLQLFFFLFLFPSESLAQTSLWSSDPTVNLPLIISSGDQYLGQTISDSQEGMIFSWRDNIGDIYVQRVDKNGSFLWPENGTRVVQSTNSSVVPRLTSDGESGVIIVWSEIRNDILGVYAQRVNRLGQIMWNQNAVTVFSTNRYEAGHEPDIASDGQGGAFITWVYGSSSAATSIYVQRINNVGNLMWNGYGVRISNWNLQRRYPKVINDGQYGAIIAWQNWSPDTTYDIYIQRISSSGQILWQQNGYPVVVAPQNQESPMLGSDGLGGVIVTWKDARGSYIQRISSDGHALWSDEGVLFSPVPSGYRDFVVDGDGNAIIIWEKGTSPNIDLAAQKISLHGNLLWNVDGVSIVELPGVQRSPRLINDGEGGAIITWEDLRLGNYNRHIYAQRINSDGNLLWLIPGIPVALAEQYQFGTQMVGSYSGGVIISWTNYRNINTNIYAQRVNSDGSLGSSQPSPTPTPTPVPCVLQNFGDANGNPIKQTDTNWAGEQYAGWTYTFPDGHTTLLPFINYGGSRDNIANWGCTLTSYAMMLNYYAELDGKTWRTNPYDLNQWLQQHNGYASGPVIYENGQPHHVNDGYVSWQGIVSYAAQDPSYLYFSVPRTGVASADNVAAFMQTADEHIIRPALCSQETKEPVMLKVINKNWVNGTPTPYPHFVVASGIEGDTYRLHDPLRNAVVTLRDQYESTFYKYTKLVRSTLSASTSFHVFSPVELVITDPLGRKTGYDPETDEHFQQIPDSEYVDDSYGAVDGASRSHKVLNLFSPIDGLYQLRVVGTGSGSYTIQQTTVDENGAFQSSIVGGNAVPASNHIFDVQFDTENAVSSTNMIRQLDINIKPHGKYNFVNPISNDMVQVAILGTPTFDATTVDLASVTFGPNHVKSFKKVPLITDFDKDRDKDYLAFFQIKGSGIMAGDTEVCIEGQTTDFIPVPFKGCGEIQTIP